MLLYYSGVIFLDFKFGGPIGYFTNLSFTSFHHPRVTIVHILAGTYGILGRR